MYSPGSPVLSSISGSGCGGSADSHYTNSHHHHHNHHNHFHNTNQLIGGKSGASTGASNSCLKFAYFATFIISTTCLGLLSASLATHKWIVSRPIRILKLNGGQTNATSLMLTAQNLDFIDQQKSRAHSSALAWNEQPSVASSGNTNNQLLFLFDDPQTRSSSNQFKSSALPTSSGQQNNKFQGEIYFGLFNGVKVLNYGFGDRISQMTVYPTSPQVKEASRTTTAASQQNLVNFKIWLTTLICVVVAIIFALVSAIFAIINFVMTPGSSLAGPVGLVIWNSIASFSSLIALISWLIEYFVRLKANVLTAEEVQNGWTSENRSQFGYSYYLVLTAFTLHLVNILTISVVQFETWTHSKAAKRQLRATAACEGVIMLY